MGGPSIVSVRKIWDRGAHNAFTDLVRFKGRWFCAFREADGHAGSVGRVRILESADATAWTSAAVLNEKDIDLRDPKLTVTPDKKLMLLMGGTPARAQIGGQRQPRVAFSQDGLIWTRPQPVLSEGDWLWRVTWFRSRAYGISYRIRSARTWNIFLHESADGIHYTLVSPLSVPGKPNEGTVRFLPNGRALALVRREGGDATGWIGTSAPPYSLWQWRSAGVRIGGPNFIITPDGAMWAACRQYDNDAPATVMAKMSRTTLRPFLTLPSGGDCSYPGLVLYRGALWVSYYSSHEGKASIYLACVKL